MKTLEEIELAARENLGSLQRGIAIYINEIESIDDLDLHQRRARIEALLNNVNLMFEAFSIQGCTVPSKQYGNLIYVLSCLGALQDTHDESDRKELTDEIQRYTAEIDLGLMSDPLYQEFRKRRVE
jgi:hypothetical protein